MSIPVACRPILLAGLVFPLWPVGCAKDPVAGYVDAATIADTAVVGAPDTVEAAPPVSGSVVISSVTRTPRSSSGLGTSYWQWSPTWGDLVAGTESQILRLAPMVVRMGGYNNDANTPDPFDEAQIDTAVAYARAIAAEPILQVPLLADTSGSTPTAATAAAMVTYANVTKAYAIKYFSIGNEPDLYPDAAGSTKGIAGYTPAAFCSSVSAYVAAMKAVDPSIKILGPELSWKYQSGSNDWLTPILQTCGALFDVVTVHRYPIDPAQTTVENAAADANSFATTLARLRTMMAAAGMAEKPLAITECNITWDGEPAKSTLPASPGTVPAGLWAADTFGVGLQAGLWAMVYWSTREGWTLGLFPSGGGEPRPSYWALDLFASQFGPTLLTVTSMPSGVRAYASRNQADTATQVIVVNWNRAVANLSFEVGGLDASTAVAAFALPALSVAAIEIPDVGAATALTYGEAQYQARLPPQALP
jgi:hypothetical protein